MRLIIAVSVLALLGSCKADPPKANEAKEPTPPQAPQPVPTAPQVAEPTAAAAPTAQPLKVMGIQVTPPAGWVRETPKSRMRIAQFKLPRAEGDTSDGELTVIAAGGTPDANIQRWAGQFEGGAEMTRRTVKAGDKTIVIAEHTGTFLYKSRPMAPGPGTPMPNTTVKGAIVELGQGRSLFIKSWGPKATMDKHAPAFDKMLQAIR